MTTKAGERTEYERTPENEADEEAAFNAAFETPDQAPVEVEDKPVEAEPEVEDGQQEVAPEAIAAPAVEPEPVKEPTIADLMAIIEANKTENQKLRDTVFGKVGELKQKIEAMKTQSHGISPAARERLKADFPELADMLFEEAAPVEQQPVEVQPQAAAPVAEDGDRKIERRLLTWDHRDWEQIVAGQEFADWKDSMLKPEEVAALDESWDADFISGKITQFKEWKAAEAKRTAESDLKKQRLNQAVVPRGVPRVNTSSSGADDEEAAMLEAFGKNKR